jgi:hypothetical protein
VIANKLQDTTVLQQQLGIDEYVANLIVRAAKEMNSK